MTYAWFDVTRNAGIARIMHMSYRSKTYTWKDVILVKRNMILSPPTAWRKQSQFVSSRQSGQILAAVRTGFECRCNGQNGCRFKCSHTFLQCIPRQMLVCCIVCVGSGSNVAVTLFVVCCKAFFWA